MLKIFLDPVFQVFGLIVAIGFLAYVGYDLYSDARDPSPSPGFVRRRPRPAARAETSGAPRPEATFVEASVEIWTDSQGRAQGRVRRGPCRGMQLDEMDREQCEAQNAYCRQHDYAAAAALEAYIRQRFYAQRRNQTRIDGTMSRAQAFSILGLTEGASEADIHAAYLAMIKKHHPDHGGSTAAAARVNQAKDLLAG
jgi:hypothetical protein